MSLRKIKPQIPGRIWEVKCPECKGKKKIRGKMNLVTRRFSRQDCFFL